MNFPKLTNCQNTPSTRGKGKRGFCIPLSLAFLLLLLTGFSFPEESIKQSVTDFEWCFKNPFGTEMSSYDTHWLLYQDNFGCNIQDVKFYAYKKVSYKEETCRNDRTCTSFKTNLTEEICNTVVRCRNETRTITEKYDITKEDFTLDKEDKVCMIGKRKASTNHQSCDMNFRYDNGLVIEDAKDYGKLWWNATFQRKRQIQIENRSNLTTSTPFPLKIVLNASNFDFNSVQDNCSDVRFVNAAETAELDYMFDFCDKANSRAAFFVNVTILNTTNATPYIYYNASTPVSTTSDANATFGPLGFLVTFDDTPNDKSNRQQVASKGFSPQQASEGVQYRFNTSGLFQQADNDLYNYSNPLPNSSFTACYWALHDATDADSEAITYMWLGAATKTQIMSYADPLDNLDTQIGADNIVCTIDNLVDVFVDDGYHHICQVQDNDAGADNYRVYVDGIQWGKLTCNARNFGFDPDGVFPIANTYTPTVNSNWDGRIDEFKIIHDDMDYLWVFLDSDQPTATIGGESTVTASTEVFLTITDEDYNLLPNSTDEGEDFWVFAAYNYTGNSSTVGPDIGMCSYSAVDIIDEEYDQNLGVNTTVCLGGACTYTNRTAAFTGFDTDGYSYDIFRLKVCHNGNVRRGFQLSSSCGAVYSFGLADAPLCSAGWTNISVVDGNCSGSGNVNLSVTSSGTGLTQALRLVDDFVGMDRLHNHSANMTFNVTRQEWQTERLHEYYDHGVKNISVNCTNNASDVSNQTETNISIVVVNAPPVILIDSIWDWFNGVQAFTDNIDMKYPLSAPVGVPFLNISAVVQDDDLDTVIYYLNYSSNNSNINTLVLSNGDNAVNYTQSNFTVNLTFLDGTEGYTFQVWANDTLANFSTSQRSFFAENLPSVAAWTNATPLNLNLNPAVLNYSCTDPEVESSTGFVFINGTFNKTGSGTGVEYNFSEGLFNLNLSCDDSFRNGTNASLAVTFSTACILNLSGLSDGDRFPDDSFNLTMNCTNGVTINNCGYRINGFVYQEISNCSLSFEVLAERGWNIFNFTTNRGETNENSDVINFWAKKRDSVIWDYPVIFFMIAVALLFILAAFFTRVAILHLVAGLVFSYVGWEILAFSTWGGYLTIIGGLLYGFIMLLYEF